MNGETQRKGGLFKTRVSVDDRWVISGSVCLIHLHESIRTREAMEVKLRLQLPNTLD